MFSDINNYNYYDRKNNPINLINKFREENNNIKNIFLNDDDDSQNKINYNNETYYYNPCMLAFYASESYLKYLLKINFFTFTQKNLMTISNKIFPVKYANDKFVVIKSIYNYQLK